MPNHYQRHQTKRLVIGLSGRIGAGKTSAGKHLSSKHQFQYLRYSQVLSEWRGTDPDNKVSLQKIGWEVMSQGMQAKLNKRLVKQIEPPPRDVAIDGLRHPTDYASLKNSCGSAFHLVYIESSRQSRWNRLRANGKYTDFEAFETADSHPVEQQIKNFRDFAELVIRNEGTLQEFHMALDKAVEDFRGNR
jgi:dephospho-CoA kinase